MALLRGFGSTLTGGGLLGGKLLNAAAKRGGAAGAPVRGGGTPGASNVNAQAALRSKLSALENAQKSAVRTRSLPDGRLRYYGAETPARTAGPTRGASYATEYNPRTGQVRSWMESYDHAGNTTRVHPKMIDGQTVNAPHYPPTGKELAQ
jgi:filamentous hemagglutinin